ncbi:ROK family protein [Lysinimonas soli]|uniref:ROK family protein n=1 Tax=Lysinimonas soli TaxID=1074233 RepID=A0ABW0NUM5_9MICO
MRRHRSSKPSCDRFDGRRSTLTAPEQSKEDDVGSDSTSTSPAGPRSAAVRIGIDIGGTKTEAVAVDGCGRVLYSVELPTVPGPRAVIDTAVAAANRVAELSHVAMSGLDAIGVGVPGTVNTVTGEVQHALNLGVTRLDLGNQLAQRFGSTVRVDNDVKAAALGAYRVMAVRNSMAYLNLGTGTAAGIIVDGRVLRGAKGAAGEVGHIPIDPGGARCPCGQRGCLETVASGSGIARQWSTDDPYPVRALLAAAAGGDLAARAVQRRLVEGIASAVRVLVLTVDVNAVVLGGGLTRLGRTLIGEVHGVLAGWAESSPFLESLNLPGRLMLVPEGSHAAAVGAALLGDDGSWKS